MRDLAFLKAIPPMSPADIRRVQKLEAFLLARPQLTLPVQHVLHAGMYSRTIMVPARHMMTGALIKVPTMLVVQGDCYVTVGSEVKRITGYAVLAAAAGRKQAFRTEADTHITMIFPTEARTVEEAEREFTDDHEMLNSRRPDGVNEVVNTGVRP